MNLLLAGSWRWLLSPVPAGSPLLQLRVPHCKLEVPLRAAAQPPPTIWCLAREGRKQHCSLLVSDHPRPWGRRGQVSSWLRRKWASHLEQNGIRQLKTAPAASGAWVSPGPFSGKHPGFQGSELLSDTAEEEFIPAGAQGAFNSPRV